MDREVDDFAIISMSPKPKKSHIIDQRAGFKLILAKKDLEMMVNRGYSHGIFTRNERVTQLFFEPE